MNGAYFLEDFDVCGNQLKSHPNDVGKYGLVFVFAHWCHNCGGMKDVYNQLLQIYANNPKLRLYVLNGTGVRHAVESERSRESEDKLMKRWKDVVAPLQAGFFPALYLFGPDGKVLKYYEGARTFDGIKAFLQNEIKGL